MKALEFFNLTEEELDALIAQCLSEGWKLGDGIHVMLIPPDERINWCAEWIKYKGMFIPHWIGREYTGSNFK